ncbi:hypothetical protein ACJJTC_014265 [Scirpophaga incertulas]
MENVAEILQQQNRMIQLMQEQITRLSQLGTHPTNSNSNNVNVPWPAPLNVNLDPEDAFRMFKAAWLNYCKATQMDTWPSDQNARKVSILMSAIGEESLQKYNRFGIVENIQTCEEVLDIMASKLVPKKNIIYNRYIFLARNQDISEPFNIFYSDLIRLIDECDYKDFRDEMLRDKIVLGIHDTSLKKELLKKDKLTLNDAINHCRASEVTEKQMKSLTVSASLADNNIKKVFKLRKCKFCGNEHEFKKGICPAWGKECSACKGKNHFSQVCKKKKKNVREIRNEMETVLEERNDDQDSSSDSDHIVVNKISYISKKIKNAECPLKFKVGKNWIDFNCLLDTAADECIIGKSNLENMFGKKYCEKNMRQSKKQLYGFGGNNIVICGEIDLLVKTQIKNTVTKYQITFQVVHTDHIPLLSCNACTNMGLITFCKEVRQKSNTDNIIEKYQTVFDGQGRFAGEVNLEIDESVPPVIQKARRIPIALRTFPTVLNNTTILKTI